MKRHSRQRQERGGAADTPAPEARGRRLLLVLILLLAGVGLFLAGDLALIHYRVHSDPSYRSYCAISTEVNCDTVAESRFAVFLGLPVAVWGLLGYGAIGVLALSGLWRRRPHPGWPAGVLLVLATVAVATSLALALISKLVIRSVCVLCLASWLVNLALLVVAVLTARRAGGGLGGAVAGDVRALLGRRRLAGGLGAAGLIVVGCLFAFYPRYWTASLRSPTGPATAGIGTDGLPWIGSRNPRLTITEFSDYECPHCRRAHAEVRALVERHKDVVRLVHRHFPLDHQCNPSVTRPFHRSACRLAAAATCAGAQGKFWEMNDALFEAEGERDVEAIARRLQLDVGRLQECLAKPGTAGHLADDIRVGTGLGVRGTPAFAVGTDLFRGQIPPGEIARRLEAALAAPAAAAPRGAP